MAKHLYGEYCYSPGLGWMHWNSQRWEDVTEEVVIEVARKRHRAWYSAAFADSVTSETSDPATQLLKRLLMRSGVTSVVALCRGLLIVDAGQFDSHRHLLNTPTGVVDLRTGELLEHDPSYYMTKITSVGYVPGAKHKDWDAVLRAVRSDARRWLQIRIGNAITGEQPDDDGVMFLRGGGENGKSTLIGVLCALLGSYYRLMSDKVLFRDAQSHSTELTDFRGVRMATVEELPEGRHLNAVALKKSTGQEITARRIRRDDITFPVTHSLFVTSNYATNVTETDHGTWRRLLLLVFPYTFVKGKRRLGPGEKRGDPTLRDRVRRDPAVQEAALAWAVEGAVAWYANGPAMPDVPESVQADIDAWRAESDLVFRFFNEHLVADHDRHIRSGELAEEVNNWLRGEGHQKWSSATINARFGSHQLFKQNRVEGPKYTKATRPGLSTRNWEPVKVGYQAFLGVRFAEEEDD